MIKYTLPQIYTLKGAIDEYLTLLEKDNDAKITDFKEYITNNLYKTESRQILDIKSDNMKDILLHIRNLVDFTTEDGAILLVDTEDTFKEFKESLFEATTPFLKEEITSLLMKKLTSEQKSEEDARYELIYSENNINRYIGDKLKTIIQEKFLSNEEINFNEIVSADEIPGLLEEIKMHYTEAKLDSSLVNSSYQDYVLTEEGGNNMGQTSMQTVITETLTDARENLEQVRQELVTSTELVQAKSTEAQKVLTGMVQQAFSSLEGTAEEYTDKVQNVGQDAVEAFSSVIEFISRKDNLTTEEDGTLVLTNGVTVPDRLKITIDDQNLTIVDVVNNARMTFYDSQNLIAELGEYSVELVKDKAFETFGKFLELIAAVPKELEDRGKAVAMEMTDNATMMYNQFEDLGRSLDTARTQLSEETKVRHDKAQRKLDGIDQGNPILQKFQELMRSRSSARVLGSSSTGVNNPD